MNDEEKAWRLWHLMQEASDALWERNEQAFLDFCIQENEQFCTKRASAETNDKNLPF